MDQLITLKDAAERLHVEKITLLRAIADGKLEAIKLGRSYQVTEPMLEKYVKSLMVNATAEVNRHYGN